MLSPHDEETTDIFPLSALSRRNYGFPPTANEPIPILFGPGLESQQTVSENCFTLNLIILGSLVAV